ncbi:actin cross-linking protein [Striga asiatica]|uniref:Actin cross-linking protein n=1 Tax=Striga asiatica TaxID=4170 RepID=A0A5A7RFK5_STRAF|nr:actin cross-linking protein [Striga asiatica]
MEFFTKTKAVRLKSHLNKYLVAGDDQISTRQSSNGAARKARWLVELVDDNPRAVRLKSCHNRYLTASSEPFLLGMTGHKVLQTLPEDGGAWNSEIEWEPIRDGFQVRLRGFGGKYLRANGGTPPWRNSVTHDSSHAGAATNGWIVWDVEAVEVPEDEATADYWSMVSSFSSLSDEISGLESEFGFGSPISVRSGISGSPSPSRSPRRRWLSMKKSLQSPQSPLSPISRTPAMDLFRKAKSVRLKSSHDKYLIADDDEESVRQDRNGSSKSARWNVEFVDSSDSIIRLKSCYGKYLTASNQPFLLGVTGRKVLQTLPRRLDSSVEWEPIRENGAVKLKTRYGQFLRANGGLPPWRNSVTHDIPHRTATQDWVCWEVHVVEIAPPPMSAAPAAGKDDVLASDSSSPTTSYSSKSASFSRQESNDSFVSSPPKGNDGRLIYFHLADENGEIDEDFEELCITFKGNEVNELTKRLEGELGISGLTVCTRSPLNGKLYPLRLQLPPNNSTMHVVVIPPASKVNQESDKMEAPL